MRYIKTRIDNLPYVLEMDYCNFCPFLRFYANDKTISCSKFHNTSLTYFNNGICSNVSNFHVNSILINNPWWCGLSKTVSFMCTEKENSPGFYFNEYFYIKSSINSYISIYNNEKLPLVNSRYIEYDRDWIHLMFKKSIDPNTIILHPKYEIFIENDIENTTDSSSEDIFNRIVGNIANTDDTELNQIDENSVVIELNTCSCCGMEKENIDRNKNIGMCSECWDKYKNNEKMKSFSFVNNFRLKRKSSWTDEIHKIVKEFS